MGKFELGLMLTFVTASISFLVIGSKLFQWFRDWVKDCPLFKCGFCFGHWVALALVIGFQYKIFGCYWLIDIILSSLVIAWIGGFQFILMSVMIYAMEDILGE